MSNVKIITYLKKQGMDMAKLKIKIADAVRIFKLGRESKQKKVQELENRISYLEGQVYALQAIRDSNPNPLMPTTPMPITPWGDPNDSPLPYPRITYEDKTNGDPNAGMPVTTCKTEN